MKKRKLNIDDEPEEIVINVEKRTFKKSDVEPDMSDFIDEKVEPELYFKEPEVVPSPPIKENKNNEWIWLVVGLVVTVAIVYLVKLIKEQNEKNNN